MTRLCQHTNYLGEQGKERGRQNTQNYSTIPEMLQILEAYDDKPQGNLSFFLQGPHSARKY